ncbi:MAG TPA: MgtC/SapB family protein [Pseudomonadales bacterium]|nr:MgtC/SapB family protein [Pseudomonadales bacterium]
MALEVSWQDIALRLLLTVIGGVLIGMNREEHGQGAGLRTTLLVCLAASLSMIQANLLLGVAGKPQNSFVVLDLMRLPLGILSGMGFIGAGAILRKDSLVRGVTTAATLWFVTVMGLCFGGGQIGLGLSALLLGMIILGGLKRIEKHCKQHHQATLTIITGKNAPSEIELIKTITDAGYKVISSSAVLGKGAQLLEMNCEVSWHARIPDTQPFIFLKELVTHFSLAEVDWKVAR